MSAVVVEALRAARAIIASDRDCLFDSHVNPASGDVDDLALDALDDYDRTLSQIDAALAMSLEVA